MVAGILLRYATGCIGKRVGVSLAKRLAKAEIAAYRPPAAPSLPQIPKIFGEGWGGVRLGFIRSLLFL
jgi:hypothetical protein